MGYHPPVQQHVITDCNLIPDTKPDQLLATLTRTGTDTADQGHSPIPTNITVMVTMIHTDAVPGHIIETVDITIRILHNTLIPVLIIPAVTTHIADRHHTGPHQLTHGTTADHVPIQHTNQVRTLASQHKTKTGHMIKEIQVMIDGTHRLLQL